MPRTSKPKRDEMLVRMVREIGVVRTAKELNLAKSTVSELYHKNKDRVRLSTEAPIAA